MDKFLVKRKTIVDSSEPNNDDRSKQSRVEVNLPDLPSDPGMRIRILDYNPNIRDAVRRSYLLKGPCQPRNHLFPYTLFGNKSRRFNVAWFDENPTWLEYSVNQNAAYCFAHQLQLTLVAVAKKNLKVVGLFFLLTNVVNVAGGSCNKVVEALSVGEVSSGRGLNQETSLIRAGDTRWGSHYGTLISMTILFSSVIDVLDMIEEDGITQEQKYEAQLLSNSLQTFDFIFCLHFMKSLLGITNELSQALQRKEQDIVNAMSLVGLCKKQLQNLRDNGWHSMLNQVTLFCEKHDIDVCNMDEMFLLPGRSRRKAPQMTNLHYYRVELFYAVIDLQLMELENRFSETSTELLISMACLNPSNSFSAFDKSKVIRLAQFYPKDFSEMELMILDDQLETYILDMHTSTDFSNLKGIGDLAQKMVETRKDKVFPLVYLLIKLALTLPVATATVERAFSAMNIVKNKLRNRMGDQWLNDNLVTYIEKDVLNEVANEDIIDMFQKMKTRRGQC